MGMRVTFLGTGSAMPTGERFQTGILVESGEHRILVDCGSGVLHGLSRTDAGYEGVDTVLLTHHHLDHVSDLLVLLKARWLAGEETLTVAGPGGTTALVRDLLSIHEYMQDRIDLTLRDLDPEPFRLAGFDCDATETRHSLPCHAYRLTPIGPDGPTFVYSGDTEAFPELIEFADGADLLAHDCSFPDEVDVSNHPTPSSLGRALAAADAEIREVVLTHLYPHTEGRHDEMRDALGAHYDGSVEFARDGLAVEL